MDQAQPLLEMRGIHKRFAGVAALRDVNFRLFPGEVHALMGENGAGKDRKSTRLNSSHIQKSRMPSSA